MNIVVYIESLKTFTSGMPHRGMLKELIKIRNKDYFILVLRKGVIPTYIEKMLVEFEDFNNWELKTEKRSSQISNLLALFRIKNHCNLKIKGDIYLNMDANYLGIKNSPQIITVHDLSSVKKNKTSSISFIKRAARKFMISNGIRHTDYIVTISKFTKNDILSYYKSLKPITVIYNGIDSKWHNHINIRNKSCNNYWIWYGGFSKRKNLKNLLLAYEQLIKENEQTSLDIPNLRLIGNKNQYYHQIKGMIEKSTWLTNRVIFKNHMELNNLINEVANSDGLLFPSLYEGFGLPVIEAFSQGVQVLTSNSSSLPEISGGNAVLIDPCNIVDIKKGLNSLLNEECINKERKVKEWSLKFLYKNSAQQYSEFIDLVIEENNNNDQI